MKDTFERLPAEKKAKIVQACILEFGEQGYEGGATDRICRQAGISKGGLYEYIDSKRELFLFAIGEVYERLYQFIRAALKRSRQAPPADLLDRFMKVSEIAIDFYLEHPDCIRLIQKANILGDQGLREEAAGIFRKSFMSVFGDLDGGKLRFPPAQVLDLLVWLLVKTRNDFLDGAARGESQNSLRRSYLKEWRFYLDALRRGAYS